MDLAIAATTFPIIFLGELPDKTMFASLVLASRGRPVAVWGGVALSFLVHVVIAVAVGAAVFALLPHRLVEGVVAALFVAGAAWSWVTRNAHEEEAEGGKVTRSAGRTFAAAAGVIFVAEWGDLTQILTANLAAHYHAPFSVGVGAVVALWLVAGIAVAGGTGLLRYISVRTLRLAMAVVLLGLGAYSAVSAFN
jgi:putative Ca2+/H+ antiporter (TMEM165/GDT1 family)